MELDKAVSQISEIHKHLAKSEIFRGYKPQTVLTIGIISIIFSIFQFIFFRNITGLHFIIQWSVLGSLIFIVIIGNILIQCFTTENNFEKHQKYKMLLQFTPAIAVGSIITLIAICLYNSLLVFIPGIWAFLFGLGIFSMLPYLPKTTFFLGLFYIIAGTILLVLIKYNLSLFSFSLGITFGAGHFIAALILYIYFIRNKYE